MFRKWSCSPGRIQGEFPVYPEPWEILGSPRLPRLLSPQEDSPRQGRKETGGNGFLFPQMKARVRACAPASFLWPIFLSGLGFCH